MDMSVQVESEDQEDIVTNTPSKRRTRAMRIVDYDEESPELEEEEEVDDGEEDAEGVRSQPFTPVVVLIDPIRIVRSRRTGVRPGIGTPNPRCIEAKDQTQASSTLGVGGIISTHLTRYSCPTNYLRAHL